ncbi:siphovirus ReqiPepy6 Gp37-like family protein [Streptomyces sp. NPDC047967]|uniref:siphovirus ReqiPepy6 Gp37-like family protein n=1 Tax=Streptomyces sp. NPDC047967 TaxID=3154924 RepID=UPI0033C4BD2A
MEVIDRNLKRVGEIDSWISLDFSVRLSQEGIWQLLIKDGTPQAAMIQKGGGIVIWQDGVSKPILSGQVDSYQKYWTKLQHTGPGSLYIAGKCHNSLAYRRLLFPDPAKPVSQQYLARGASRPIRVTEGAGHLIYDEVNKSMGPAALTDRRIPNLNLTDSAVGLGIGDTVRFDGLGVKLEEWCKERSVAYRFIYNPVTQKIDLEIFTPKDRSKGVRFSPDLGNLTEYIWTLSAPKITRAIVGCAGEGKDRYMKQKIDTASEAEWGMQIERFVDRRDIPVKTNTTTGQPMKSDPELSADEYTAALASVDDALTTALTEGEGNGNFQIYPIDTDDCKFGRDYFVGDIVTVAVDGTEYSDVVREVTISVDDGGKATEIRPKIGEQGSGEPLNLYKTVFEMQRKLDRLQARM